jgi:hypothetical protein
MSRPVNGFDGRIGCAFLHTDSVYQPLLPSLLTDSTSASVLLNTSSFIRNYTQLKYMFMSKEMHI